MTRPGFRRPCQRTARDYCGTSGGEELSPGGPAGPAGPGGPASPPPRAVAAYRMRQRPPGWQRSGKSIAVRRLIRRVFLTAYYGEVAPHWLARRPFQSWLAHSCRTKLLMWLFLTAALVIFVF